MDGGWGDPLRQGCDQDLWLSLGFVGEALWVRPRGRGFVGGVSKVFLHLRHSQGFVGDASMVLLHRRHSLGFVGEASWARIRG
mgnify:CR=1 FL=1